MTKKRKTQSFNYLDIVSVSGWKGPRRAVIVCKGVKQDGHQLWGIYYLSKKDRMVGGWHIPVVWVSDLSIKRERDARPLPWQTVRAIERLMPEFKRRREQMKNPKKMVADAWAALASKIR